MTQLDVCGRADLWEQLNAAVEELYLELLDAADAQARRTVRLKYDVAVSNIVYRLFDEGEEVTSEGAEK